MIRNIILILEQYGVVFVEGLFNTLWLSFISLLIGTIFGILVAVARMSSKTFNKLFAIYIELLRGTPTLLQLYFFWLVVPKFIPDMPDILCVLCALVVNASAYVAEIIRAGIEAVDHGQREAALSLGMTEKNIMTKIIFPQAIKNILPALGNEMIIMIKETSLASTFFVGELMTAYRRVQSVTFLAIEPLCISGAIYLVLTIGLSQIVRRYEKRLKANDR